MQEKRIECLQGSNGLVYDTPEILMIVASYYKELFKKEDRGVVFLDDNFWDLEERILVAENLELESPFSDMEVKSAVFDSYSEGAPGPDGLPFLFYQKFWNVIKEDLMNLVRDFQIGDLDLFRINFATLTLIPKMESATEMKSFRPISLLNCSFKIFGRLLTSRLEKVCARLIEQEQSAFIRGRYILESVVLTHEVVHNLLKIKTPGIILV
jgi:hypothetical protein